MCEKRHMEWKLTKAKISSLLFLGRDMEHSPDKEFKILLEFTMRGKLNWKLKRRKSGLLSFAQNSQESNTRLFWKIYRTSSQHFGQVGARTGFITLLLKWRHFPKLSVIDGWMMTSLTVFSKCWIVTQRNTCFLLPQNRSCIQPKLNKIWELK